MQVVIASTLMPTWLQVVQTLQLPSQGSDSGTGTCLGPAATMLAVAAGGARAAAAGPASVALLALQSLAMQAALELPKVSGLTMPPSPSVSHMQLGTCGAPCLYGVCGHELTCPGSPDVKVQGVEVSCATVSSRVLGLSPCQPGQIPMHDVEYQCSGVHPRARAPAATDVARP